MKIKMLTAQSGPKISRQYGHEYDLDNVEAVRLVRSGQAEALNKSEYEKALKELVKIEAQEIEAQKDLATTKLAEAEAEAEGLIADVNEAKAKLVDAKSEVDKVLRKLSNKGKEIVKLEAVVDAEVREEAAKVKEALAKVAASEKKSASKKSGGGSTKKTSTPNPDKPKPLSKMNNGELEAEVAKLEGIKAEEIKRINKLSNKDKVKEIKAYKAPKTSSDDNTGKNQSKPPAASKPAATKE